MRNREFDIVHSRSGHTSGNYAKLCAKMNIPFVVSIHNERPMFKNDWAKHRILSLFRSKYLSFHKKLTEKYASRIIGHSKANLRYYSDVFGSQGVSEKHGVIYNGVNFSKFLDKTPLSSSASLHFNTLRDRVKVLLVHIGRFKEQKNHKFLLHVFEKLKPSENEIGLILIGEGELIDNLKLFVIERGLEKNILFVGQETNIGPYLFFSDIFVFPSLYEGFGNVLIEAQYARLPLWVSDIAPHYESAYKGYHKYMFKPSDLEDGVNKLTSLIKDNTSGNLFEIKNDAFLFSKEFSIESMSTKLINLYRELLESDKK